MPVEKQAVARPSVGVAKMSHTPESKRWSVEIYHVMNRDRQQRILEVFRDIAHVDVTVLGTQSGRGHFVVVETSSWDDRFFARTTIASIDVHAARTYTFKAPTVLGPMPA
jgi:hypothetical protein